MRRLIRPLPMFFFIPSSLQPDLAKFSIGSGFYTRKEGQPRRGLGRLNADGSVDATFNREAKVMFSL